MANYSAILGLLIALEHPEFNSRPQVLCAAARTCKAWREAVQQCQACRLDIHLVLAASLEQVRSSASWLPKHAQLVKSITANVQRQYHWTVLQETAHQDEAVAVLSQALHAAAATTTSARQMPSVLTPSVSAAACRAPMPGNARQALQQQQGGLRLVSFSSHLPWLPSVLDALPADTLTLLDIKLVIGKEPAAAPGGSVTAALARLSKLQKLVLKVRAGNFYQSSACLDGLAELECLNSIFLVA
jgi:hypothetical protein